MKYLMILLACGSVVAGPIDIAFGISEGATGYEVCHGLSAGDRSTCIDVAAFDVVQCDAPNPGPCIKVRIDIPDRQDSYLAVRSYNASGSSDFSNEIFGWPHPTASFVWPDEIIISGVDGLSQRPTVNIRGRNLREDTNIRFVDWPQIYGTDEDLAVSSKLTFTMQVDQEIPIGTASITGQMVNGNVVGSFEVPIGMMPTPTRPPWASRTDTAP